MARPRKHPSGAARQAAYRRRQAEGEPLALSRSGAPVASAAPGPGWRRWKALLQQANVLLRATRAEMQQYLEQKSESWQDSERGETLVTRLEAVDEAQALLDELVG